MNQNELTLFHSKSIASTYLVHRYTSRFRDSTENKTGSKENTGISISKTTRPHTSKSFSMISTDVLIVTKKALTRKHKLDASKVVFSYALQK